MKAPGLVSTLDAEMLISWFEHLRSNGSACVPLQRGVVAGASERIPTVTLVVGLYTLDPVDP